MLFDLRLAWRSLFAQPALAAAIVVTVGLAVAANTALFSVLDGLLFRPLPFQDAARLVHIDAPRDAAASADDRAQVLEAVETTRLLRGTARAVSNSLFEEGAAADWRLVGADVTTNYFSVLGVTPQIGRTFVDEDGSVRPFPIMLSDAVWRARFGADAKILDRVIELPGAINSSYRFRVIGVMPRGFEFPDGTTVWRARGRSRQSDLPNYARLSAGASIEQLRAQFPRLTLTPLREHVRPGGTLALGFLLGATGLLLVIAWVQVAALLFARAAGRAREIGVRLALGAGRLRLVRQFGLEGLLVTVLALTLAWCLAPALTTFIVSLLPADMTMAQYLAPDARAFLFSCGVSLVGVLLFTWMPFEIVRRISPAGLLRGATFGAVRLSAVRTRAGLLVAQLAVTAMLLYVAGLALHSFARVAAVDLGFDPDHLIAVYMPQGGGVPPNLTRQETTEFLARHEQALNGFADAIRTVPGVTAAAEATTPPFYNDAVSREITPVADGQARGITVRMNHVAPDYFKTIGLAVVDGRPPTLEDLRGTPVVVINRRLAADLRRFGPPVGQSIRLGAQVSRVIGVVANSVDERPDRQPDPQVYFFKTGVNRFVVIRLDRHRPEPIAEMQAAVRRLWPALPDWQIIRIDDQARRATADYRARTILLGLIGALCLPLALAGMIGALLHATTQRTKEIAIRLALGAEPGDIKLGVVRQALTVVGIGLAVGLLGGLGAGRLMSAFLFQVDPLDAATIAGVAAVLFLVGGVSALIPARRASRIAPALALRES